MYLNSGNCQARWCWTSSHTKGRGHWVAQEFPEQDFGPKLQLMSLEALGWKAALLAVRR